MGSSTNTLKNLSDEELVRLILKNGDTVLFEEIYDRYASRVFQKCLSFTKNPAEAKDLAHDVIVKLFLSLNMFNEKSRFSTWLYAVTYNYCVDYQNKKAKQITLQEELKTQLNVFEGVESSDALLLEINLQTLSSLLNEISISEKTILLMKYQDGLSIKEIAEITNSGESAIKMKLKRSKAKLLKLYERRGEN